jgi:hypothetical protein
VSELWGHGDPRDIIHTIVADPRFTRSAAPAPPASWFDIVCAWIMRGVRSLLHGLDRALGSHNPFEAAIGFAVIAAGLGLLGFGIYLLVRSYLRGVPSRARSQTRMPGAVAAAEQTSAQLHVAALRAARAGRYREAARVLFLSAVRALDERGRLAYDPARTPGEYRRLVRDPLFDALAGDAVIALFAPADPPADLFERMRAAYERFLGPAV